MIGHSLTSKSSQFSASHLLRGRGQQSQDEPTYELARQLRAQSLRRTVFTGVALAALVSSLLLLGNWLRSHPFESFDIDGVGSISGWDWPASDSIFNIVAFATDARAGAVLGVFAVIYLFVSGRPRLAFGLGIAGVTVGIIATVADYTLGEWVGRARPIEGISATSFPSGHTLGSTAFFGFAMFLAIRHRVSWLVLIPMIAAAIFLIATSGVARIYQQAHWPTDVVGGYLLGLITLIILIYLNRWIESIRWISAPQLGRDIAAVPMKGVEVTGSYGSAVLLDREEGTATKIFHPPWVIRAMYWLAFQAKFPYDANPLALEAARYKRVVAGYLTQYRFGTNLVAPILSIGRVGGHPTMVSQLIEGEVAPNDAEAQAFLVEVSSLFAEAGLPIWQLNPRNPHAHTNLIRTPEGDQVIVDLESSIVTPLPAPGQFRSSLKRGNFPIFDDLDFDRLRVFVSVHDQEIRGSLGPEGYARFQESIAGAETCVKAWQGAELRIPSRVIRISYALLNWKSLFVRTSRAISSADMKAEAFLSRGLDLWLEEGRITQREADRLKSELKTPEVHDAMKHLGAHLAITAVLRFPFGSILRPLWTLWFFMRGFVRPLKRGSTTRRETLVLHNPIVMLLSIIPGFGGFAYLTAKPLRRGILIRLMLDRMGRKIPFDLYRRTRVHLLIAPVAAFTSWAPQPQRIAVQ